MSKISELEELLAEYIELAKKSLASVQVQSDQLGDIAEEWHALKARVSMLERSVLYRDMPGGER